MMMKYILYLFFIVCAVITHAQYTPIVTVDDVTIQHGPEGWRVLSVSKGPAHFNLSQNDLIVRIDGKNASETGPMQMASLFNMGLRRNVNLFLRRGNDHVETLLRRILPADYNPVGGNPFRHVAVGFSAPDFSIEDIDHHPVTLEQYKGKWLLIDFIGTWCAPCMASFPQVLDVVRHRQVDFLVISLDDKEPALRRLQHQYSLDAPIAMLHGMAPLPVDFGVTTNLYTGQVPALALIDPEGDVSLVAIGSDPQQVAIQVAGLTKPRHETLPK
jgi:peroxiredoxin